MSIFAQVRFYKPNGHYASCWLCINTDNLTIASMVLEGVKVGWEVNRDNGRFVWDQVQSILHGSRYYMIPHDIAKLGEILNESNSPQDKG